MIQQTTLLNLTVSPLALAPALIGGAPAFDLSLAALRDEAASPLQHPAATGKALPATPTAVILPGVAIPPLPSTPTAPVLPDDAIARPTLAAPEVTPTPGLVGSVKPPLSSEPQANTRPRARPLAQAIAAPIATLLVAEHAKRSLFLDKPVESGPVALPRTLDQSIAAQRPAPLADAALSVAIPLDATNLPVLTAAPVDISGGSTPAEPSLAPAPRMQHARAQSGEPSSITISADADVVIVARHPAKHVPATDLAVSPPATDVPQVPRAESAPVTTSLTCSEAWPPPEVTDVPAPAIAAEPAILAPVPVPVPPSPSAVTVPDDAAPAAPIASAEPPILTPTAAGIAPVAVSAPVHQPPVTAPAVASTSPAATPVRVAPPRSEPVQATDPITSIAAVAQAPVASTAAAPVDPARRVAVPPVSPAIIPVPAAAAVPLAPDMPARTGAAPSAVFPSPPRATRGEQAPVTLAPAISNTIAPERSAAAVGVPVQAGPAAPLPAASPPPAASATPVASPPPPGSPTIASTASLPAAPISDEVVVQDRPRIANSPVRVPLAESVAPRLATGTTAPAFRLFAAAIHTARAEEGDRAGPLATLAAIEQPRAAVAVGGAEGAPLDMTDRRWPHAMVERIERLQDAAGAARDAASTSIRLVPDALGAIDVGVRRDGDTLHVHFSAEQAQTRTLLSDAQPRLQEIAEAKGLKLAQAGVGTGADGQAQRQPSPRTPARSAPAPAARDDQREDATTTRVA